ncbi:universal stress protein [Curvibacter sp. CHRR-16]|uniref:universal stress protein n=1 Tax=Curvibacter sp. CHRR-16 TaxID=2835872 RepID=UPI001BD9AEF4|nr:universal stress protein [Curvibacter sp. CHRR-16]MBT0570973.1 universal stress protein [Curvibacter sp. CHRR-16]
MFKHILVATDGSATSEHAAKMAVQMAKLHNAKLTALYVTDPYPFVGVGPVNPEGYQAYMVAAEKVAAEAHATVETFCAEAGYTGLNKRTLQDMTAAIGIVEAAKSEDADLIIMGSHGRTGIVRLMLGSVAGRVVAESPIPVLVAR